MCAPTRCTTWGWNQPARVVLTILAALAGLALCWMRPSQGEPNVTIPALVVDLNTAPPSVLGALPRLGPSLVRRIVEAREHAPFRSLDDFDARVPGIGPATVSALRPYVRVAPNEP
jgi:competence protein ComEA